MIRSGHAGAYFPTEVPYRPGVGVGGTVAGVGPGTDPSWRGRRVVASTQTRNGYAEAAAVPVTDLIGDVQLTPDYRATYLGRALHAAAAGDLHPLIGQEYPLEQAAAAHAGIENRSAVGKTLLSAVSA
jgi:NADPH2:quinone reductase